MAFLAEFIQPMTSFLPVLDFLFEGQAIPKRVADLLLGNPTSGVIVYLTIPVIIGASIALIDREDPGLNSLLAGFASGFVNALLAAYQFSQLRDAILTSFTPLDYSNYISQISLQFALFVAMLVFLWGFVAAFSAKASTWSLEIRKASAHPKS